jgi:hypothetical protein
MEYAEKTHRERRKWAVEGTPSTGKERVRCSSCERKEWWTWRGREQAHAPPSQEGRPSSPWSDVYECEFAKEEEGCVVEVNSAPAVVEGVCGVRERERSEPTRQEREICAKFHIIPIIPIYRGIFWPSDMTQTSQICLKRSKYD